MSGVSRNICRVARACVRRAVGYGSLLCAILLVFRFDSDIHGYDLGLSPLAGLLFVSQPCFGCLARIEGWGGRRVVGRNPTAHCPFSEVEEPCIAPIAPCVSLRSGGKGGRSRSHRVPTSCGPPLHT